MLKIKKITRDKYETEFLKLKTDISDSTICTNLSIMAVLEKSFSYQVNVFGFFDNGRLVGILPTCKIGFKLVSLPHFSYGGFLCGPLYVNKCLTSFENFCYENSLDYEIRGFEKLSKYTYTDKVTAFLSLKPDSKEILSSFKSKLRSQIVKSYKNGLFCKVGSSSSLLKEFYLIYSKNMLTLGSPPLPKLFFDNLQSLYVNGEVKIFVVYNAESHPVGAGFTLGFDGFSEVCWASTLREFNSLAPNMMMYWEMIKYYSDNGYDIFSFGRGSKGGGSIKFKKQWGPELLQLYFNYSNEQKLQIKNFRLLSRVWSKLPIKVSIFFGKYISRFIY